LRLFELPLVTSARFEQWNRRGREGDGAGRKPVQRSKPCVGHGGILVIAMAESMPLSKRSGGTHDAHHELISDPVDIKPLGH
jgi:hypothetical protein